MVIISITDSKDAGGRRVRCEGETRVRRVRTSGLGGDGRGVPARLRRGSEEFMTVRPRGSVQHLASRVTGRLGENAGPWDAFAFLFPPPSSPRSPPPVCPSATPSTPWPATRTDPASCTAARSSGAAPPSGALDAALVLRSLIGDGEETWLRAGGGVTAQSSPVQPGPGDRGDLRETTQWRPAPAVQHGLTGVVRPRPLSARCGFGRALADRSEPFPASPAGAGARLSHLRGLRGRGPLLTVIGARSGGR